MLAPIEQWRQATESRGNSAHQKSAVLGLAALAKCLEHQVARQLCGGQHGCSLAAGAAMLQLCRDQPPLQSLQPRNWPCHLSVCLISWQTALCVICLRVLARVHARISMLVLLWTLFWILCGSHGLPDCGHSLPADSGATLPCNAQHQILIKTAQGLFHFDDYGGAARLPGQCRTQKVARILFDTHQRRPHHTQLTICGAAVTTEQPASAPLRTLQQKISQVVLNLCIIGSIAWQCEAIVAQQLRVALGGAVGNAELLAGLQVMVRVEFKLVPALQNCVKIVPAVVCAVLGASSGACGAQSCAHTQTFSETRGTIACAASNNAPVKVLQGCEPCASNVPACCIAA